MRRSPTSCIVTAALLVGAALVGCAADATNGGPGDVLPGSGSSSTDKDDGGDGTPAFTPHFDEDGGDRGDGGTPTTPGSCTDPNDPGGTEPLATKLPDIDDCGDDLVPQTGTLLTSTDVDMYKVSGTDKTGCLLDTKFESETAGTQICVFARCRNSTTDPVTGCAAGSTASTNDLGWKGCCANGPGEATPQWDCSGIFDDDSADFYIRIKPTTANACVSYTFKYRF